MVEVAAFYYVPMETVGHGWKGDYTDIIKVFCKSASLAGITPVHICPIGVNPVCTDYFSCMPGIGKLVYDREVAYREYLKCSKETVMFCDPDQVFLRSIPSSNDEINVQLVIRHNDSAMFNGPRILNPKAIQLLDDTIENMRYMSDQYKQWDGDSSAFANAVYKFMIFRRHEIVFGNPNYYISRPTLGAPKNSFMYHFKGNAGKDEMLEFGRERGWI